MMKKNIFNLVFIALIVISSCSKKSSDKVTPPVNPYSGFYSRINADGSVTKIQDATYSATGTHDKGTKWDCVRFNESEKRTVWTVNSVSGDEPLNLRLTNRKFTWYQPGGDNSGNAGKQAVACDSITCDTKGFIDWANSKKLCGVSNWRIPTVDEFQAIIQYDATRPNKSSINADQFPISNYGFYWSSVTDPEDASKALGILFSQGGVTASSYKSAAYSARLIGNLPDPK